jgi:hypothetical protein
MSRVHIYDGMLPGHNNTNNVVQDIINDNIQLLLFIFKLTLLYRAQKLGWEVKKKGMNKFTITRTFHDVNDYDFDLIVSELIGCNSMKINA